MVRRLALTGSVPVTLLRRVSFYRSYTWWSDVQANTSWGRERVESHDSAWIQSWASLKLECNLCQWCQLSICWPLLRGPIMGTDPIGHYHGRLTFIGCCYHCTDQQKLSPGWFKCGRAFMDMDKIDLSDITQTWGKATATITAKMEFAFEEQRSWIVVWEENQSPKGAAHKASSIDHIGTIS